MTLDDDVAAAVAKLRRERGIGQSQALNQLARSGMAARAVPSTFRQRTASIGLQVAVDNVAEALEQLDGPTSR